MKEGELIRKIGVFSLEKTGEAYSIQSYINNFEIENYFLKGVALGDPKEYQVFNGASISIEKTGFYGEKNTINRLLIRPTKLPLQRQ